MKIKTCLLHVFCILSFPVACLAGKEGLSVTDPPTQAANGFWGAFSVPPATRAGSTTLTNQRHSALANRAEASAIKAEEKQHPVPIVWQAAVQLAVSQHPAISSSLAMLGSSEFALNAARAGYLPAVRAGVTSGRQQAQASNGQIATLGLSQMLYDFGKTGSAVDIASARQLRQQAEVLGQIDAIIQQTALSLNERWRYTQLIENAKEQVRLLRGILQLTQLRAEAGASTRVDPVQASARVEAALAQQFELETKLQQQHAHLQSLIGQSINVDRLQPPPDLSASVRQASALTDLSQNTSLLMAQADAAAAFAELRSYKAQRYPTLSLEANTNKYVGDIASKQSRSQFQNIYLSLNSTLYQGGALLSQESASAKALDASRATLASIRRDVEWQQQSYVHSIKGIEKNIQVLQERMKTITETRSLYREQYLALGNRNALDLLNAEQEISRAQQDLINAKCDLWASSMNYLVITGMARKVFESNNQSVQEFSLSQ